MDAGDWATWAAAGIALAAAAVASIQAGRANSAAHRSAAADERAAAAAERANELAEQQVTKYLPEWAISPLSIYDYEVTNRTGEPAYGVTVRSLNGGALFGDGVPDPEDLDHGESLTFTVMPGVLGGDRRVVVAWSREPGGEQLTQRKPLPPQPPRTPPRSLNRP